MHPVRKHYKGKEYSDALQFVVTDKGANGIPEDHFLFRENTYSINGRLVKVNDFSDASELEEFLTSETVSSAITVERVCYTYGDYESYKKVDIRHSGFVGTHVVGKLYTKLSSVTFRVKSKLKTFRKG